MAAYSGVCVDALPQRALRVKTCWGLKSEPRVFLASVSSLIRGLFFASRNVIFCAPGILMDKIVLDNIVLDKIVLMDIILMDKKTVRATLAFPGFPYECQFTRVGKQLKTFLAKMANQLIWQDIAALTTAKEKTVLAMEMLKDMIGKKQKKLEDARSNGRKEEVGACGFFVSVCPFRAHARTSARTHGRLSPASVRRFGVSRRTLPL